MIDSKKLYKSVIFVILPYEFHKNDDIVYYMDEVRLLPRMNIQVCFKNNLKHKNVSDLLDNDVILLNNKKYIIISKI